MEQEYTEQLKILRQGCKEPIYTGSFNGEEPYNTGWRCGSKTEGVILYCNSCWKLINKVEGKLEGKVKEKGE